MSNKKIKIGLVGCGYIATEVHMPLLKNLNDATVVALCDSNTCNSSNLSRKFNIPLVYDNIENMLEAQEIDLLDICTPPKTHASIMKTAIMHRCPCLVEKPFTTTVSEADQIILLSRTKGVPVFVLHNWSYTPCMRKVRKLMAEGRIGIIKIAETRYFTSLQKERYNEQSHWIYDLPGGILNSEVTPHLLMQLVEFLGDIRNTDIQTLKVSNPEYVSKDELRMSLVTDRGVGFLGLSFNSPISYHTLDLIGDKGSVFVDLFSQTLAYHKNPEYRYGHELSKNSLARGRWFIGDITQRTGFFASTALRVLLGSYKMLAEGHNFLIKQCLQNLRGEGEYPVSLDKCRAVVEVLQQLETVKVTH